MHVDNPIRFVRERDKSGRNRKKVEYLYRPEETS
jgi:hypothetical protein